MQGFWKHDDAYFLGYHEHPRGHEEFVAWLKEWVLDLPDREAYRAKLGAPRVGTLRITEKRLPIGEVNYRC